MKSEVREKMHHMLDLVLDINESGKATTFMDFSGHVNIAIVSSYIPKWEPDYDPDIRDQVSLSRYDDPGYMEVSLDEAIANLEKVMKGE